ncbi:MAG: hypothetical protein ACK4YP_01125 [Myxococcota bacterium]
MSSAPPPTLPILWSSFVMSHGLFVGLSFFLPPEPMAEAGWGPALGLPAVVAAGLAAEGSVLGRAAQNLQTWFLLRFALAEVAGIVGFIAWFLTGDHLVQLGCAGAGLLAHLAAFPTARAVETYAELSRR